MGNLANSCCFGTSNDIDFTRTIVLDPKQGKKFDEMSQRWNRHGQSIGRTKIFDEANLFDLS
jgi:hypothetical protein